MKTNAELANAKRQQAAHIRDIARHLSLKADQDKLLGQALELEAEADALERQANPSGQADTPRGV